MGSLTEQMTLKVGCAVNGSSFAVSGSGTMSMSEALIGCQPRIEDPSNPKPSSKHASLNRLAGTVVCCQMPGKSMNFRSTNLTSFFLANSTTSLGFIRLLLALLSQFFATQISIGQFGDPPPDEAARRPKKHNRKKMVSNRFLAAFA